MFRHWSWAPIFRVAWAVGAPTFGRSFVTFCELRLDMPRLNDVVRVEEDSPNGKPWDAHCETLAADGRINHVERSILLSRPIVGGGHAKALQLFLLKLKWQRVLESCEDELPDDTTCGVAVLDGGVLRILRVQDHLRRMGLGLAFMRSSGGGSAERHRRAERRRLRPRRQPDEKPSRKDAGRSTRAAYESANGGQVVSLSCPCRMPRQWRRAVPRGGNLQLCTPARVSRPAGLYAFKRCRVLFR